MNHKFYSTSAAVVVLLGAAGCGSAPVRIDTAFNQMVPEKCQEQIRLAATTDARENLHQSVVLSFNQAIQIRLSGEFHKGLFKDLESFCSSSAIQRHSIPPSCARLHLNHAPI